MAFLSLNVNAQIKEFVQDASQVGMNQAAKGFAKAIFDGKVKWGVRANGLINTTSLGDLENVKNLDNHGFNIGISARYDFVKEFFANPELYYTHVGNGSLDLPILFGYQLSESIAIVAGPNFSYAFSENSEDDLIEISTGVLTDTYSMGNISSKLTFGYQAGLQFFLPNFVISAKYNGSFTGQVVDLINQTTGGELKEEIKTSYVSIGIGYNFGK